VVVNNLREGEEEIRRYEQCFAGDVFPRKDKKD